MSLDRPTNTFGEQAARFSVYVPVCVLLIGCFARSNSDPNVSLILFWLNVSLILAGFVLGIIVLLSMKQYGTEGILGRAIAGILLNGLCIGLLIVVMLPLLGAGRTKDQVVGHWRMTNKPDPAIKQIDLTLTKNGRFDLTTQRVDGISVTIDGTWVFTPKRLIGVTVEHVNASGGANADTSMVGKKIGLGTVKTIDQEQMVLATDKGEESYKRLP